MKQVMASSSSVDKSEIVGWTFGLKLEVTVSSEHLRKPEKKPIRTLRRVCGHWSGSLSGGRRNGLNNGIEEGF